MSETYNTEATLIAIRMILTEENKPFSEDLYSNLVETLDELLFTTDDFTEEQLLNVVDSSFRKLSLTKEDTLRRKIRKELLRHPPEKVIDDFEEDFLNDNSAVSRFMKMFIETDSNETGENKEKESNASNEIKKYSVYGTYKEREMARTLKLLDSYLVRIKKDALLAAINAVAAGYHSYNNLKHK